MQFEQYPQAHKKRRNSGSEPPASKRKIPQSYPTLYANLPPAFARSLSVDGLGSSSTPVSQRSSPGLDWLQQTQDLQLHTPPMGQEQQQQSWQHQQHGMEHDVGMNLGISGDEHSMMDDDPPHHHHPHSYEPSPAPPPTPAAPIQHHASHIPPSFAFADPTFMPLVPSSSRPAVPAPHDAPPLHHHLAGSPQPLASQGMTPSSSAGSLHSHSHAHPHGPVPTSPTASMGGKGGWKVTMGYRPDCEKCVRREPNHYSHVVYSG